MSRIEKLRELFAHLEQSPHNTGFDDLCRLAVKVGFVLDRQNSSHRIYKHSRFPDRMNFQDVKGKAKPYQITQLLEFIRNNNLLGEGANDE